MNQNPKSSKRFQILLVDDHPIVRDGLAESINREADMNVCAVAEDRTTALKAIEGAQPDLAIVDLTLRNSSGLDLIKDIRARWPEVLVLVVSMHEETVYAERAIRAGARGYITKQQATHDILSAIRRVLSGEIYLNQSTSASLLQRLTSGTKSSGGSPAERLADRELQVFELTGKGLNTKEIAEQLKIDTKTVETYRLRIKEKLGLATGSQLLQTAIQWLKER